MCKKLLQFSFLFLFLASMPAFSEDQMRIVVMNLKADEVPDRTARTVSNMLRTEFINLKRFTVVERAQMDAILKEQGMQQTGCTDQECAVQIGKLMSARKILVGEVSPMGQSIIITVRIVDVEQGISEFAATEKASSEDVLDRSVSLIAKKIAQRIRGSRAAAELLAEEVEEVREPGVITKGGYYARGFIPGWGQIYAGKTTKGIIIGGVFAASAALTLIAIASYSDKKRAYDDLGSNQPPETYDTAYKDYEDAAGGAKFFTAIFGIIYAANWIDIIFFSKPNFRAQAAMIEQPVNYFSFNAIHPFRFSNEKIYNLSFITRF